MPTENKNKEYFNVKLTMEGTEQEISEMFSTMYKDNKCLQWELCPCDEFGNDDKDYCEYF